MENTLCLRAYNDHMSPFYFGVMLVFVAQAAIFSMIHGGEAAGAAKQNEEAKEEEYESIAPIC
jgi:hypothetical protein